MKRVILICFFLIMTMLLLGCKLKNGNDYKIYEKNYTAHNEEDKPFKVKYAQISGLSNERLENKINKTLKLSIIEWINKNCEWMERGQIDVKCKTSKYLSLCYTVEWKDDRGEDYMSTYTRIGVTVELQTGKRVYLDDLIKETESLKQKLEKYNYGNEFSPPIDSKDADNILHDTSISEKKYFKVIYKTDQYVYDFMSSYLISKSSFYLTDNKLVITRDEYDLDDVYIDFKQ